MDLLRFLNVPQKKAPPIRGKSYTPYTHVLPLMGGYESTEKTIVRKRDTQKSLRKTATLPHRKELNKKFCGSFEVFECLSGKKPPDQRQIVYPVYPQVYVLPLIGGYESMETTIARKRASQTTLQETDPILYIFYIEKHQIKGFVELLRPLSVSRRKRQSHENGTHRKSHIEKNQTKSFVRCMGAG